MPTRRKGHEMATSNEARLASYERNYRLLAERITHIGYIAAGSITERYTQCGKPN